MKLRDSGYGYLSYIPGHWNVDRLKYHLKRNSTKNHSECDVLSLYREFGIVPKNSRDDNHNVTSEDTSKYLYVKNGDFVVNKMKAWQGSVAVSEYTGIVSPAYFVYSFKDSNVLDRRYFHYLIRNKQYTTEFRRLSGGIREGQWDLPAYELENVRILIPPIEEQKRIATFLDEKCNEIDNLISDIQEQIEILREYKKSVITETVTKGLDSDVKMKDSGIEWIGEIPVNYFVTKIKYYASLNGRIGFRGYNQSDLVGEEEGAITLSPTNIKDGKLLYDKCSYISWIKYNESPEIKINNGDILLVKTGSSFGKSAYVRNLPKEATINPQLLVIKEIKMSRKYFFYYLQSLIFLNQINNAVVGGTIPTVAQERIYNFYLVLPNMMKQIEIVHYLDKISTEIDTIIDLKNQQMEVLSQYKNSLIYEYVTGKKEVF